MLAMAIHSCLPHGQSGDFLYLTGITQSGLLAAITARGEGVAPRFTLFTPPSLPERDRWDGARMRPEAAAEVFGADEAYPSTEVRTHVSHPRSGCLRQRHRQEVIYSPCLCALGIVCALRGDLSSAGE